MVSDTDIQEFLTTFFKLFGAKVGSIIVDNNNVSGVLIWETEEEQSFLWNIPDENMNLRDIIELIRYLLLNKLTNGDKINISEESLIKKLLAPKWDTKKIANTMKGLLSIKIYMIDFGKKTDSFFLHY